MSVVYLIVTTSGRGGCRSKFIMQWILTLVPWGYEGLMRLINPCVYYGDSISVG
jgi:hypothetical protein